MKYRKKPVIVEAVQYLLCENKNGTKNNNIVKLAKYNKKQKQKKAYGFINMERFIGKIAIG